LRWRWLAGQRNRKKQKQKGAKMAKIIVTNRSRAQQIKVNFR
jgi:hypothetical protein